MLFLFESIFKLLRSLRVGVTYFYITESRPNCSQQSSGWLNFPNEKPALLKTCAKSGPH